MASAAPVLVPVALAVILFSPATVGSKVLSASDIPLFSPPFTPPPGELAPKNPLQFDAATQFEPDGLFARRAIRGGRLPVWSPFHGAGRPVLAEQQSAPLYPLNWIAYVFPFWGSLVWIAVIKLALAALGTFLLARALALERGPALLAAITFAFGTYLIDWLMHPHANDYVLLPWLFWLGERLCRRGRVVDAVALGLMLGVVNLGGHPESALIVALGAAAWVLYRLLAARPSRPELVRTLSLGVGAAVLGLAVAAVMLLPFAEALRQAYNTSRSVPGLPLKSVTSIFFPEFWGRPDRVGTISLGPVNFGERTLYVGALPTLLAAAGLVSRRPRGPQLFFAVLTAIALVTALHNPLGSLIAKLPVLDQIDVNRALILASFGIAMLAAFGVADLASADARQRRRMLGASAAVAVLPPLAGLAAHPSRFGELGRGIRHLFAGGALVTPDQTAAASIVRWVVFAGAALVLFALFPRLRRRRWPVVVPALALVALDLLVMDWGVNPAIPLAQAAPPAPPAVTVMRRLTAGGERVIGIDALQPNTASRWRLLDARQRENPFVERSQRLWSVLGGGLELTSLGALPQKPATAKLLDVFGVRTVLLPASVRSQLAAPMRSYPVAYSGPGGVVLENPAALPPAFVAYNWVRSPSLVVSLFAMAARPAAQARDDPVIETRASPPGGTPRAATPARVLSRTDTTVTLDVTATAPGRLVLLDTYYPGWRATVDGRTAPIEPADAAFDSIPIGAGHHRVRFSYHPTSVIVGGVITIAALALSALVAFVAARRGRPGAATRRGRPGL